MASRATYYIFAQMGQESPQVLCQPMPKAEGNITLHIAFLSLRNKYSGIDAREEM